MITFKQVKDILDDLYGDNLGDSIAIRVVDGDEIIYEEDCLELAHDYVDTQIFNLSEIDETRKVKSVMYEENYYDDDPHFDSDAIIKPAIYINLK